MEETVLWSIFTCAAAHVKDLRRENWEWGAISVKAKDPQNWNDVLESKRTIGLCENHPQPYVSHTADNVKAKHVSQVQED